MAPRALEGLLVADFSRVLAGPLCTMVLGDLGADVVKVERVGSGDDTRGWGPPWSRDDPATATYYQGLNRNKRSIALDLQHDGDLALAHELAARADVVVSSFRPGLMASLGLDHDTLAAADPRTISCDVSAFGSGPEVAHLPGYDLLAQAMGGLMSITGEQDGRPLKVGAAVVDMTCGLYAAIGVLAALAERERTGVGRRVEVSLLDSALTMLLNQASAYLNAGVVPGRMGNRHPSIVPYETYAAADRELVLAVGNDAIFARLCADVLGRADLARDERFATNPARAANRDALNAELEAALATATADEWIERCAAAAVPAGPINAVDEAFALAERLGLQPIDETGGVRTVASPIRLDGERAPVDRPPPALGEHDAQLRAWLRAPRD